MIEIGYADMFGIPYFIGAFRRGNKPPVLPGEDKKL